MPETFWMLTSTAWTAIGAMANVIYSGLTLFLVIFAYVQITSARSEARINRTLAVCDRYDLDPQLDAFCRKIAAARDNGDLEKNPRSYRLDMCSILNYLESMAIGVERGLYDKEVVRDYMEPILRGYVQEFIKSGLLERAKPIEPVHDDVLNTEQYFSGTIKLDKEWAENPKGK
ncbi:MULTISPECIES: hypothetical protein [unclassified Bradyrhizobium]|uniref:DUF4760 domain-containing protein n=1 Tax=unclassified Bradyrhizobium TaxID=2631580 RepID=UPI001BA9C443|nr:MULTISPECIES: hypothetical protein [unclassified Bradyrhizobium]MBR1207093.1 hypothetical protein [Bradyrhizobium sp. AUGA SZCCT0124]MBR1313632.1 hypothetical protein [Bradyrhizobium sp. AUGA SZCCT0051]MBR1343271.1 hypothetical protein [Bradyrhizobium sp. AUGA SZCCT0105]MBR1357309.1 hypothetical protein [Bradyrhizobium sp. AUGA SZCCT0045]